MTISSKDILELSKQMAILAIDMEKLDDLGKLEELKIKLNNIEEDNARIISYNKKLKTENNETRRNYDNLEKKYNNTKKRLEKFEEIYSTIPGTTREDKERMLLFIIEKILYWVIESSNSRTFKKVVEYWNNFTKKYNNKTSTTKYYVYSHTIIGERFPFYIGFSRNNDGQYNRSTEFSTRSEKWHEYVSIRGTTTNIDVNIIGEVETEEAVKKLERFYISHYSDNLVNIYLDSNITR